MEQKNRKYELILGFVTLIISLSAFKEELKIINLNLGFLNLNLADYFLYIVFGFGLCIYLYIIVHTARFSKMFSTYKIINYLEKFAFSIFVFIIISPIVLLIIYLGYFIFERFSLIDETKNSYLSSIIGLLLGIASSIISSIITHKYYRIRNKQAQEEIEREEIIELDKAIKLYDNKFYSPSIIEAFKVLETHLIKLFTKMNINVQRHQFSFNDLFDNAIKLKILNKKDINTLNEIKHMRNTAAHLDVEHTKEQATKTIEFIKYLIKRTST
jgi:hypothetical protein